jgi:hypothetical protein
MARSEKLGEFGLLLCLRHQGHHALHYFRLAQNAARLEQVLDLDISLWMAASSYASLSMVALNLRALTSPPGIGSCSTCGRWAAIYSDATIQQT